MIERPRTHEKETAEETANWYLTNLGLEWKDLEGTKVLDIGALNAAFENAARRRGVDVVSLDKEIIEGDYMPPKDSRFVIANATKLPFAEESFDYAVAHLSVTNYIEKGYKEEDYLIYLEDVLREVCRILKPSGQFRFTGSGEDDEKHRILEKIAKQVGFRELRQEKYPDAHPGRDEYLLTHYYVAVKSEEKHRKDA